MNSAKYAALSDAEVKIANRVARSVADTEDARLCFLTYRDDSQRERIGEWLARNLGATGSVCIDRGDEASVHGLIARFGGAARQRAGATER